MKTTLLRLAAAAALLAIYLVYNALVPDPVPAARYPVRFEVRRPLPDRYLAAARLDRPFHVLRVVVAGRFSDWKPDDPDYTMREGPPGTWRKTLALSAGRNPYKFVLHVSNRHQGYRRIWIPDPTNGEKEDDGHGGHNSIMVIDSRGKLKPIVNLVLIILCCGLLLHALLEHLFLFLMGRRMSLKQKLTTAFLILFVPSCLVLVFVNRSHLLEYARKIQIDKISTLHSMLLGGGVDFSRLDNPDNRKRTATILSNFFRNTFLRQEYQGFSNRRQQILYLALLNRQGRLLLEQMTRSHYGVRKALLGKESLITHANRTLAGQMFRAYRTSRTPAKTLYACFSGNFSAGKRFISDRYLMNTRFFPWDYFIYPIYSSGKPVGYYLFHSNPESYSSLFRRMFLFNVFIVTALSLLVIVLVRKIGQILLIPLRQLVSGMDQVKQGNLDSTLDIHTRDEFEGLGKAYNFMAEQLRSSQNRIQEYASNLEFRVGERTRELMDKTQELIVIKEDLEDANRKLQDLSRERTRFFTSISHELRTPLTLIIGPLESMLAGSLPAEPEALKMMHTYSMRLLKLINDLLDFSRLESGKLPTRFQRSNVIRQLQFYLHTLAPFAEVHGVSIRLECAKEAIWLYLDTSLFEKIILGLLIRFFQAASQDGSLLIRVEEPGDMVEISLQGELHSEEETGTDQENQATLAQGFLSLERHLVEIHGGNLLEASTAPGTFAYRLTFPAGKAHLPPSAVSDQEGDEPFIPDYDLAQFTSYLRGETRPAAEIDQGDGSGTIVPEIEDEGDFVDANVLLVENNPDMRQYLTSLLQGRVNVHLAKNGREGLKQALRLKPDLIISDSMLHGMGGNDFCKRLKSDPLLRYIPLILLTAKADITRKIEGLRQGADDYLSKPFDSQELLARIQNLLKNRRLQLQLWYEKQENEQDLDMAARVQRNILTQKSEFRTLSAVSIDVRYEPLNGKVSGDYYNIAPLEGGGTSILIADATGHGVQAAMSTMQIDLLCKESYEIKFPDERLEYINYRFAADLGGNNFFTCFLVHILEDRIQYAAAGHPSQYLLQATSKQLVKLKPEGDMIGMNPQSRYTLREHPIAPGDILFLFSDGIYEEFNEDYEEFGEDRLLQLFREQAKAATSMTALIDGVMAGVRAFRAGNTVNDDITLVAARVQQEPE